MSDQVRDRIVRIDGHFDRGRIAFEPDTDPNRDRVRAWADCDGEHVWVAHDCADGREVTMLPWPRWQAVQAVTGGREITPSVSCDACGLHVFPAIQWELSDG